MQKLKLLIPLALFIGAFFLACQDDDPLARQDQMVYVTFVGQIVDENGAGLKDALVKAGNESTVTDPNGIFRLKPVRLSADHALLSVSKPGYFEMSRPYTVEHNGAMQVVTIQLLTKTAVGTLSATAGGVVNVPGGPSLNFPANAFTDGNGNAYNGTVQVFAQYLDPSDPMLGSFLPGNMTAEDLTGETVFLATYGMVGVEIETTGGQKLQIASDKSVELKMPIIASQQASAPSEIPLWHYDLVDGVWKEEGLAQKIGNEYVGHVKHFSFWNCDAPFPVIKVHGRVLDNTQLPLGYVTVCVTMLSTGAVGYAYTDINGYFCGLIPQNEALLMEIIRPGICGNTLYSQNIGPFSTETNLPDIILQNQAQFPSFELEGHLRDCAGQSISNGYLKFELSDGTPYFLFPDNDGDFVFNAILCNQQAVTGSLVGYDLTNFLESAPVNVSFPPYKVNIGDISICNSLTEYIRFSLDGGPEQTAINARGGVDGNLTVIMAGDSVQTNTSIVFSFPNNGQLGNFPIDFLRLTQLDVFDMGTLATEVTSTGGIGAVIEGTFGGNFIEFNGTSRNITGSYRVIRDW
jgi:hypothetical protein